MGSYTDIISNGGFDPRNGADKMDTRKAKLSQVLIDIALNRTFSEQALYDAKNCDCTTNNDRQMLDRYLHGKQTSTDHIALQELANYILEEAGK